MFTFVLIALTFAIVAALVAVVRTDRSVTPPRSHTHELDPHTARVLRVI